ncbi:MAG: CPXCG motif-containing cysteine-rich protein [Verrucomicrobiota bacterium]
MEVYPVTCPTCFESFDVPLPPAEETPSDVDYDCEVCCRPMVIHFREDSEEVVAEASGIHD